MRGTASHRLVQYRVTCGKSTGRHQLAKLPAATCSWKIAFFPLVLIAALVYSHQLLLREQAEGLTVVVRFMGIRSVGLHLGEQNDRCEHGLGGRL